MDAAMATVRRQPPAGSGFTFPQAPPPKSPARGLDLVEENPFNNVAATQIIDDEDVSMSPSRSRKLPLTPESSVLNRHAI